MPPCDEPLCPAVATIGTRCAVHVKTLCRWEQPTDPATGMAPGWSGPHHCAGCAASIARGIEQFDTAVKAGELGPDGYTVEERAAKDHRRQIGLFD